MTFSSPWMVLEMTSNVPLDPPEKKKKGVDWVVGCGVGTSIMPTLSRDSESLVAIRTGILGARCKPPGTINVDRVSTVGWAEHAPCLLGSGNVASSIGTPLSKETERPSQWHSGTRVSALTPQQGKILSSARAGVFPCRL